MIVGVAIVRNEDDIIATTIRHHLALGLDRILISDNESTDDTLSVIKRLAAGDRRIRWTTSTGFNQENVVNALAEDARKLGADWILPFDADEFWRCEVGLADLLAAVPAAAAAVLGDVVNFVQHRDQQRREPKGILRATFRAAGMIGCVADARPLVETGGASFVEIAYAKKGAFRAGSGRTIGAGGHGFIGAATYAMTDQLACLHLPLRSRDILDEKVAHSRRLDAAGLPPEHGWQQRHFAKQAAAGLLDAEWGANSAGDDATLSAVRGQVPLREDRTLVDLIAPHVA